MRDHFQKSTRVVALALISAMALTLAACGGGGGGGSGGGGSGSGGGGSGTGSANLSINVSGLTSGGSVTVQATATLNSQQLSQQSVTASSNGSVSFAQPIQTHDALGNSSQVTLKITSQPGNGEQCFTGVTSVNADSSNSTWSFNPASVPVYCSSPVKPAAYPQLGAFPGVSTATVIASPKVVPIFLSGSANENTDLTFLQQLVVSQYWSALAEYGVGNGTVESALYPTAPTSLNSNSVSDAEVQSAIQANNAWGAPLDSSTVLVVFLPAGIGYIPATNSGEPYDASGDHGQVSVSGVNVQYVVVLTTSGGTEMQQIARYLVDAVTNPGGSGPNMGNSDGYVEMATNPDSYAGMFKSNPQAGYSDLNHLGQEFIELGSACDAVAPSESDLTLPSGISLYAIWSNVDAGKEYTSGNYGYCQPGFGETVDYSASSDAQTVTATRFGHTFSDQALVVPAGGSTTVTLTAWGQDIANGAQTAWTLSVNPEVYYTSGAAAPVDCSPGTPNYQSALVPAACADAPAVSVSPSGSTAVANGDTFTVTVTMSKSAEPGLWSILLSGTDGGTEPPILVTNGTTWQ